MPTLSRPKATLLALEQFIDDIGNPQLTDVVRTANSIFSLGVDERIDTIELVQMFIDNPKMNKFIAITLSNVTQIPLEECTVEDHTDAFVQLAEAFAVLSAAVYWKCKGSERLTETIAHMSAISRQIDQPQP